MATPGTRKDDKDKPWISKHYLTLSLVAGVVILTGLAGYKILRNHPSFSTHAAASVASKKKDFSS